VTGSPASIFPHTFSKNTAISEISLPEPGSNYFTKPDSRSIVYPPTPPLEAIDYKSSPKLTNYTSSPVAIPTKVVPRHNENGQHQLATPPLTPEEGKGDTKVKGHSNKNDALDFLLTIFPSDGLSVLPFAKSVAISAPNMNAVFDGAVLELPGKPRTLYVDGKSAETVRLRERCDTIFPSSIVTVTQYLPRSIVALLDLADETLGCSALVIALERSSSALGDLLHSLMYVGGTVVTKPPFKVDSAYVLVGMEI
jgi:hypothetical protein